MHKCDTKTEKRSPILNSWPILRMSNHLLPLFLWSWSSVCHATCSLSLYTKLSTAVVSLKLVFGLSCYLFLVVVYQIIYCCCFFTVGLRVVELLVPWHCITNYLLLLFLYSWSLGCHATCSLSLYTKLSTAFCFFEVGVWVVTLLVPCRCIPNYLLLVVSLFEVGLWVVTLLVQDRCFPNYLLLLFLCGWSWRCHAWI